MPVSITLQASMNFVRPYLKNQPLDVTNMEPSLSAANLVLQMLLAPPFRWRYNRRTLTFATVAGTTDYSLLIPDFGYLENAWLVDQASKVHALSGRLSLDIDNTTGRPTLIAPQYDDDEGNITFRLRNTPNAVYLVNADYQRRASSMTSFASTWDVVPDDFSGCFNLGFLCFASILVNDSRFPVYERWFLSRILSLQDGLDDQARDIFMQVWMGGLRTLTRTQGLAAAGNTGRST
jgi:hypothetical protein